MTGNEIRKKFLDYFAARGHRIIRSSSLVPANDPTLLFTNAGMNQFKDVFLGREHRDYTRAASSQKCMRAGGKHNDLENVGRTRRHHTFFEMLGNFSFGDYFKKEAIEYAWELVIEEFGLPVERLFFTVFEGGLGVPKDEEAAEFWLKAGAPADRVRGGGITDNFWAMGETGPCGPCSEIHYDMGPEASDRSHPKCLFPCDCGRYIEIWNLVFMQFDRDANGALTPLPRPCVDTGMGLERVAAVVQGKVSNFETDLLWPLVEAGAELAGVSYGEKGTYDPPVQRAIDFSLRVLADHSRAATFLVHDGVLPSNERRGYVLRKIIRRAAQRGRFLSLDAPFLYKMAGKVAEIMKDGYPELLESNQRVADVIKREEERFAKIGPVALQEFENVAAAVLGSTPSQYPAFQMGDRGIPGNRTLLPGEKLFRLNDTFGMPLDWIREIASERGFIVDEAGVEEEMQRQRERGRASWKGVAKEVVSPLYSDVVKDKGTVVFEGYQQTTSHNCEVLGLIQDLQGTPRSTVRRLDISAGEKAHVILNHTPFYAEAGGQVGDAGVLLDEQTQELVATVEDTYSPVSGVIAHRITSRSPIRVGDRLTAVVDAEKRRAAMRNHTGTHLLHAALHQVLGGHVKQAGSVVEPARLRFDFSHFASVTADELEEIERLANAAIVRNAPVETEVLELDQALESGALAFFGEKYPERVRVVSVPEFSKELCGGTHVSRTGDIGLLKVTSEGSISAGVRRIEAVTGARALEQFQAVTSVVHRMAASLKTSPAELPEMVEKLVEAQRQLEKQVESLQFKMAQAQLADVEQQVRSVKDVRVLSLRFEALDRAQMRQMADLLRQRLKSGVVVLASAADGKVSLIAALTPDLTKRLHAGKIAQAVAKRLGGTGGGRPDIAEAGGKNVNMLDSVLNDVYEIVGAML